MQEKRDDSPAPSTTPPPPPNNNNNKSPAADFNLGLFVCDEPDFHPIPSRTIKLRAFEPHVVLLINRCAQHGVRFGLQTSLSAKRGILVRVDSITPIFNSGELLADCFTEGVYELASEPTREEAAQLHTCRAVELDLAEGFHGERTRELTKRCRALLERRLRECGPHVAAQVFQDPYLRNVVHAVPSGDDDDPAAVVALSYFLIDVLDVDVELRFEPNVNARLEACARAMEGEGGVGGRGEARGEFEFRIQRQQRSAFPLRRLFTADRSAVEFSRNALFATGWLVLLGVAMGGFETLLQGLRRAFTQKLEPAALAYFQSITTKPYGQQAVSFLNAYWPEIGNQAEFIFSCAYETIKYADMHAKGVMYLHLYDEGTDLDFNIGLYFYEQLVKRVLEAPEGAKWRNDKVWKPSMPEMQTAIVRKQELREKVDVDFDGRISFLEYLLYQYREFCNPADFVERSMRATVADDDAMIAAKAALEDVNAAIRAYQAEKIRLEELAEGTGVKALGAKNQLAQLNSSPLLERLQVALIKAEAAIRLATKAAMERSKSGGPSNQAGNMFWMNRELEQNKALYGRKN